MLLTAFCSCSKDANHDDASNQINELTQEYEQKTDIEFGNTTYNFATDAQNCFYVQTRNFAAANTGYYYFDYDNEYNCWLKFYDKSANKALPVCQRIDCTHDTTDCDSFFANDEDVTETDGRLWYYDGKLYYVSKQYADNTIDYILNSINLDGSIRTKVCKICTLNNSDKGIMSPEVLIHRGIVYYSLSNAEISYLYKIDLNNTDTSTEICRCSGFYTGIYNMQGYGDGICFQCYYYAEETSDENDFSEKVFYYNNNTNELSFLTDDILGLYSLADNGIVYSNGTDMMCRSFEDNSSLVLINDCISVPSYDGKYIYLDNINEIETEITDATQRAISVYDTNGNLIDTIALENNMIQSDFGDADYLLQYFIDDSDNCVLYVFDKNQIGTEKHDWIKVE